MYCGLLVAKPVLEIFDEPLMLMLALLMASMGISNLTKANELATITVKISKIDNQRLFDRVVEAVNRSTISAQTSGRITEINF